MTARSEALIPAVREGGLLTHASTAVFPVAWAGRTLKSRSGKRTITLDAVTKDLLLAWRSTQQELRKEREPLGIWQNTGYVSTYEDGRPYHPDNISQTLEALVKRFGLPPIRLHGLRHCAASPQSRRWPVRPKQTHPVVPVPR
ncbi:hypothetical protein OG897_35390 [Streptomyces sp. NBC_00237]|uniref:hypothetical protein n=1 Tax=Streptomyces sp. NBC_00237 TaxID=2975687 RepID=UPI0022583BF6|nr:hypothetical protein [Streptomyces sp. NBC_00237]MCX5206677.1 hypothetical protein [Streptomyces sp. NBC_00237]